MVGFDVRSMMEEDLDEVFKLNNRGDFLLNNYQNDYKEHKILVAQLNDDIIGYIKYEILKDINFKKALVIKELVVDENYRGLGVAHQLMLEVEKVAKNYSIASSIILNNNYLGEEVIFYKRQGFNLNLDRRYEKIFH